MKETLNYVIVGVVTALIIYLISPSILSNRVEIIEATSSNIQPASLKLSYSDTFSKVKASVVTIHTASRTPRNNYFFVDPRTGKVRRIQARPSRGQGSGVVVSNVGHIITNFHVIESATEIGVIDFEGKEYGAVVIGVDPDTDLAVLKVDASMKPIVFGNSSEVNVGDVALAIGNPLGVGQTLTLGIISATGRSTDDSNPYETFIQTDASINKGNSGGALVNLNGELIGINSSLSSITGGSDGIGWAIPVDMTKNILTQILEQGEVTRGFLGFKNVAGFNGQGLLVERVYKNSPADKAGLRVGDVIKKIDEVEINEIREAANLVAQLAPGKSVILDVQRKERNLKLELIVTKRPIEK